ncbi:MAG: hypothetical protein AAFY37_06205 [Pseudomonadota bacterium]
MWCGGQTVLAIALVGAVPLSVSGEEPSDSRPADLRGEVTVPDLVPGDGAAIFSADGRFKRDATVGAWAFDDGYLCLSDADGALVCGKVEPEEMTPGPEAATSDLSDRPQNAALVAE